MTLRAIAALNLPDATPAEVGATAFPVFMNLDPMDLLVDEAYQRNLSQRSVKLIRKIVEQWNWSRFKPVVVVRVDGGYHVIDGQHTAIAAVSHGGLASLPVMLVEAAETKDRARAFVGHNRDRLGITSQQLFYAEVAAGDEDAMTIAQVCERAGVTILKYPPTGGVFRVGETQSIVTIRALIDKRGAASARKVLQILVEAKCAPLGADLIKAVAELMFAKEYAGTFDPVSLSTAVRSLGGTTPAEVIQFAAVKRMPLWRALVIHLANRKGRRGLVAVG